MNGISVLKKACVLGLVLSFGMVLCAFAKPQLSVDVSDEAIYLGDAFRMQVVLDQGSAQGASPQFDSLGKAQVRGGQPQSQSSRSVQIINGRRSESVIERTVWTYEVMPEAAGTYVIGNVSLVSEGKTLTQRVPDVRVVGPEPQPYMVVELDSSRAQVLLEERFDVDVSVTVFNPQSMGNLTQGKLGIAFLGEDAVAGATYQHELSAILQPLLQGEATDGRFYINDFSVNSGHSMFSMFDQPQLAVFNLPRTESVIDGKPAWTYRLSIPMQATAEGVCQFPAVSFKGQVYVLENEDIKRASVFAMSEPLRVEVTPPPEEGRPESFIGTLGTELEAEVTLDTQVCRQGDPLILTLDVTGDFTRGNIRTPDIFKNTVLAERFRPYGDVEDESTAEGMRYTYKVRPIVSGTIEVPPLDIAFYNTETRSYETVQSAPVPLRVEAAPEFNMDAILGLSTNDVTAQLVLKKQTVPSGITVAATGGEPIEQGWSYVMLGVILGVPPLVYLSIWFMSVFWRKRRSLEKAVRRRSATGRSVRKILRAKTPQHVMDAVGVVMRDKMDLNQGGITPRDVQTALKGQGVDPATCDEILVLLQDVFDAEFRPGSDAVAVVKTHRKRLAELFASIRWVIVFGVMCAGAISSTADSFVWRQANAAAGVAHTPNEFRGVAQIYRELLNQGVENEEVYYNYGTMLLLAECPKEAADAFARAEALNGTSPEIEHNLDLALRAIRDEESVDAASVGSALPWYRVPLFWHYGTPVLLREQILAGAWVLLWSGLVLKLFGLQRIGKVCVCVAIIGFVFIGSSVCASHRIVMRDLPPIPDLLEAINVAGEKM